MRPKPKRALWVGLKTGIKPHGFSKSTKQRKRIKPRSKAMEKKMRVYRKQREDFLRRNPRCQIFPQGRSEDVHHRKGRGKYLLDESTWMAVGRIAHTVIHNNPAWAYEHGYLERRG